MMMHNEPRVVPVAPGAILVRLSEILGVLKNQAPLQLALPDQVSVLESARLNLQNAIESGDRDARKTAFETAQTVLMHFHEAAMQTSENTELTLEKLRFPQSSSVEGALETVDVTSVLATFAQPQKQVSMTLSFDDAPGAIAYWLRETRVIGDEEVHDDLIENFAPVFQRVRLAPGAHRFRIESRNLHNIALSDEFSITIPDAR